jgi:hypothetical protein
MQAAIVNPTLVALRECLPAITAGIALLQPLGENFSQLQNLHCPYSFQSRNDYVRIRIRFCETIENRHQVRAWIPVEVFHRIQPNGCRRLDLQQIDKERTERIRRESPILSISRRSPLHHSLTPGPSASWHKEAGRLLMSNCSRLAT